MTYRSARHCIQKLLKDTVAGMGMLMLTACNGIFDGIYDEPQPVVPAKGQIIVDATSWTDWYYIDLPRLQRLTEGGDAEALLKAQTEHDAYPIPMTPTGDKTTVHPKSDQGLEEGPKGMEGQYMYWFDVFGEGIRKNEFRVFTPTGTQPEPDEWTIAVHRNNVRTKGAAVFETSYTSFDELPPSSDFDNVKFTEDEWSENDVWDNQEQMLLGLVPSQGIRINKVLSSWLQLEIPPMPPAFTLNNHVFVIRLKDGTYAALQLANYLSPTGTKCWLTINYKYPY